MSFRMLSGSIFSRGRLIKGRLNALSDRELPTSAPEISAPVIESKPIEQEETLIYMFSMFGTFKTDPQYVKLFAKVLYALYPYEKTEDSYRAFYDANPIAIHEDLTEWLLAILAKVYNTTPIQFVSFPGPREWGPVYWTFLFDIADQSVPTLSGFLTELLPNIIPCEQCQTHLIAYLKRVPVTEPINEWLQALRDYISQYSSKPEVVRPFIMQDPFMKDRATRHFRTGASISLPFGYVPGKKCFSCGNK